MASFQSFKSGCGTCNASKDYTDMYYSQNPSLTQTQSGAGKKRRVLKKKTTTKKKSVSTKKKSVTKKRSMRGGSKSFELNDQFIRDNLGISFETVGGNPTPLPPQFYQSSMLDKLTTKSVSGIDAMENKLATLSGGKKKRSTKKRSTTKKKTTTKKRTTTTKKRTTTKKKRSSGKKKTTSK